MRHADEDVGRRRRGVRAAVGGVLVAVGLTGLSFTFGAPAVAGPADGDRHEVMHGMMDAIHGDGTAERMHDIEGADEMMAECSSMAETMSSMGSMMSGDGMMGR
jgi:hypothetical protein